jgi:hypothetical protein
MRRIVLLLLVVTAAGAVAAIALAAQSPKKLRASIATAMFAQGSVHYVEAGTAHGLRQSTVADVAADRGIQQVTVHVRGTTGRFTVLVVDHTVYLRGDKPALHLDLGFPSAAARKYAGRWLSIPRTSPAYGALAADVTLPSLVADHVGRRNISVAPAKVGGKYVLGLRGVTVVGAVSNTSTVYVRSAKQALPIEAKDVSSQQGFKDVLRFSGWSEPVRVTAPAHAVPISKVSGG